MGITFMPDRCADLSLLYVRRYGDSNLVVIMGGGVAGVVSWIVTYPQDVVKSRLQADSFGPDRKYQGPLHCIKVRARAHSTALRYGAKGTMAHSSASRY
jgi:hypothetical protein